MRSVVRFAGSIVAGAAVIALLGETPLGAQGAAQTLGSVNVSQKVMANGQALDKGTYTLRLLPDPVSPVPLPPINNWLFVPSLVMLIATVPLTMTLPKLIVS